MLRRIDELGRVVLPAEFRERLNMHKGNEVEITMRGDDIIISKHILGCVFCGSVCDLVQIDDKAVCNACVTRIGNAKSQ